MTTDRKGRWTWNDSKQYKMVISKPLGGYV